MTYLQQMLFYHLVTTWPKKTLLNMPLSTSEPLESLRHRYATKQFDQSQKITPEDWSAIEDALVLTPSGGVWPGPLSPPVGYRSPDDKYASAPKVRFPKDRLIISL
jgi:hypothetical protein